MENKNTIYIIDRLVVGHNHIMFNASITRIIATIFAESRVIFIAEEQHTLIIQDYNKEVKNLEFEGYIPKSSYLHAKSTLLDKINKRIEDIQFILGVYRRLDSSQPAKIFFTCLSSSSLYFANKYLKKFRNIEAYFFLHGEIENIFKLHNSFTNKLRGILYRWFLGGLGPHAKCIVLSAFIKSKLEENKLCSSEKIIAIEHPVSDLNEQSTALNNDKIIFGHLGVAIKNKNSDLFFQLASTFKDSVKSGLASFQVAGQIDKEICVLNDHHVEILSKNNSRIPQEEYVSSIGKMDYTVFTFDNENYVFRASGTLMDAIYFSKPIVALRQEYITYIFEEAGNIGFLCDNLKELERIVAALIAKDPNLLNQYKEQQENLKKLKRRFSVDEIRQSFEKLIQSPAK